jgi:hypothetical protein
VDIERRAGRIVGILFIAQMVGGFLVNFQFEAPLFGDPGFLVNAAPHALQVGVSALVGIVISSLSIAVAITLVPILRDRSEAMALWLVALGAAVLAVAVVEHASVMSMVSLSQAYSAAAPAARDQFQALRVVVSSARNWVHFLARALDGATLFGIYLALLRFRLVPRALAAIGLLATVLQVTGVTMPLFGHDVMFPLLAPLGLAQLAVSAWLLARGFNRRQRQAP